MTSATEKEALDAALKSMWDAHRGYLRRMLIGLTGDIDLADDILQETYLRAHAGIAGYRGGDARAWLATIARNALCTHSRSPGVRRSVPLEFEIQDDRPTCDSARALTLLHVRQAVAQLPPSLRTALIMKHYAGFTYNEIAEQTNCPVGTAKWRVSRAIGRLKEALGVAEEPMKITCNDLSRTRMLDFLYGSLEPDLKEAVERHFRACARCGSQRDGVSMILSALDTLESDCKLTHIVELDAEGMPTVYSNWIWVNGSDQPLNEICFCGTKSINTDYVGVRGKELVFSRDENDDPNYPNTYFYKAKLPQPIAPGEACRTIIVSHPSSDHMAVRQADGGWTFGWSHLTSVEHESAYVLAIRLPLGAQLVSVDPPAADTRSNAATTLLWRRVLPANQGFGCDIKYRFTDDRVQQRSVCDES